MATHFGFWMVMRADSNLSSVRHQSESSARAEAERLSKMNPGKTFFVMAPIAACEVVTTVWQNNPGIKSADEATF